MVRRRIMARIRRPKRRSGPVEAGRPAPVRQRGAARSLSTGLTVSDCLYLRLVAARLREMARELERLAGR